MARTKAEIRAFLDSQVGKIVPHPGYPSLNGQCVTLTKALMEFLGVPSPYAARGDAKDAGDTYLRQGLGKPGKGWLTIVVNRDMGYIGGVRYGHIWIDLQGEANYESNGARALYTTKNTRPISQGQQFINFDQWVAGGSDNMPTPVTKEYARMLHSEMEGWDLDKTHRGEYDKLFMDAWGGQPIENLLWQKWNTNGAFRAARERNRKFYEQYANIIDGLSARPTKEELQKALDQIKVEAEKARKAEAEAETERAKAAEAMLEAGKLRAEKEQAVNTGNLFTRWIGDLINKIAGVKE